MGSSARIKVSHPEFKEIYCNVVGQFQQCFCGICRGPHYREGGLQRVDGTWTGRVRQPHVGHKQREHQPAGTGSL